MTYTAQIDIMERGRSGLTLVVATIESSKSPAAVRRALVAQALKGFSADHYGYARIVRDASGQAVD